MSRSIGKQHAVRLYRRVTQLIEQTDALPVPRNFQLFFEYAEAVNPCLVKAVDQMLQSGAKPSPSELAHLFDTYVRDQDPDQEFGKMEEKLGHEVQEALEIVGDVAASTDEFQASVRNAEAELGDLSDPQRVRLAATSLVEAAQHMRHHSSDMNSRLTASMHQIVELKEALEKVTIESQKDALTGVANRKCFDQKLNTEVDEAKERDKPLSMCMIDVDHFKNFNDQFGHRAGDAALRIVASMFDHSVRESDLVARYGGEEFSVIMPNARLSVAMQVANRICASLAAKEIVKRSTGERLGNITVSVGIAQLRDDDTPESLIERADQALYEAKRTGRNQVQSEAGPHAEGPRKDERVA